MKKAADTIIIIGNGFDVCHGLPSRYSDFKAWLQVNNLELYETLNRYIDISGDWWNEFERNLAFFHVPKLINDAPKDYPQQDPRFPPTFNHPANGFFRKIKKQNESASNYSYKGKFFNKAITSSLTSFSVKYAKL